MGYMSLCVLCVHVCVTINESFILWFYITYRTLLPPTELLSEDLQAGAEDEQDYVAPEEGNLLYKLYSLQDLLLMVRSSVSLTHSRRVGQNDQNQV